MPLVNLFDLKVGQSVISKNSGYKFSITDIVEVMDFKDRHSYIRMYRVAGIYYTIVTLANEYYFVKENKDD